MLLNEIALPTEVENAKKLDKWILDYCKNKKVVSVERHHVRQYGPIRKNEMLDAAINELIVINRIKLEKSNKKLIHINPALFKMSQ